MTREELIEKISAAADVTKSQAGKALSGILEGITESLKDGQKVTLVGFGTFQVNDRKERTGFNPQTKEKLIIPARKAPVFKAGKKLKEIVK